MKHVWLFVLSTVWSTAMAECPTFASDERCNPLTGSALPADQTISEIAGALILPSSLPLNRAVPGSCDSACIARAYTAQQGTDFNGERERVRRQLTEEHIRSGLQQSMHKFLRAWESARFTNNTGSLTCPESLLTSETINRCSGRPFFAFVESTFTQVSGGVAATSFENILGQRFEQLTTEYPQRACGLRSRGGVPARLSYQAYQANRQPTEDDPVFNIIRDEAFRRIVSTDCPTNSPDCILERLARSAYTRDGQSLPPNLVEGGLLDLLESFPAGSTEKNLFSRLLNYTWHPTMRAYLSSPQAMSAYTGPRDFQGARATQIARDYYTSACEEFSRDIAAFACAETPDVLSQLPVATTDKILSSAAAQATGPRQMAVILGLSCETTRNSVPNSGIGFANDRTPQFLSKSTDQPLWGAGIDRMPVPISGNWSTYSYAGYLASNCEAAGGSAPVALPRPTASVVTEPTVDAVAPVPAAPQVSIPGPTTVPETVEVDPPPVSEPAPTPPEVALTDPQAPPPVAAQVDAPVNAGGAPVQSSTILPPAPSAVSEAPNRLADADAPRTVPSARIRELQDQRRQLETETASLEERLTAGDREPSDAEQAMLDQLRQQGEQLRVQSDQIQRLEAERDQFRRPVSRAPASIGPAAPLAPAPAQAAIDPAPLAPTVPLPAAAGVADAAEAEAAAVRVSGAGARVTGDRRSTGGPRLVATRTRPAGASGVAGTEEVTDEDANTFVESTLEALSTTPDELYSRVTLVTDEATGEQMVRIAGTTSGESTLIPLSSLRPDIAQRLTTVWERRITTETARLASQTVSYSELLSRLNASLGRQ